MAFEFRLDPLLRLRLSREMQAKLRVAEGLRALAAAQVAEARLRRRAGTARSEHERRLRAGRVGVDGFARQGLFQARMSADIETAGRAVEARLAEVTSRQADLAHATREREALERLKDKHRVRFRREEDRKDARLADELYLARYSRRTSSEPAMAGSEDEASV